LQESAAWICVTDRPGGQPGRPDYRQPDAEPDGERFAYRANVLDDQSILTVGAKLEDPAAPSSAG